MGRELAYAYKSGARPAGEPSGKRAFHDASPRPQAVGTQRNVSRVPDTSVKKQELASEKVSKCSALTRSGDPCKGRPASGSDLCTFHKK